MFSVENRAIGVQMYNNRLVNENVWPTNTKCVCVCVSRQSNLDKREKMNERNASASE